jgi:4-amino-4-deoxy-L-arabinose transferase-like glycosyltransferase
MTRNRWYTRVLYLLDAVTISDRRLALFVLCVLMISVLPKVAVEEHSETHTHLHQAIAFTKGRLWLDTRVPDVAEKEGRYYVAFPPFPSLVLMPFAYLFGTKTRTLLLTPFMGALIAMLAFRISTRLGGSRDTARWAACGFVFGTSMLLCLRFYADTYFAHTCAVLFGMLALHESFGKQRGLLVGFALGFSVLSRQATVFLIPLVWTVLLVWRPSGQPRGNGVRSVVATLVGLGICAGFYLFLNDMKFGSPFDFGYRYIQEGGWYAYRSGRWGDFNWIYIPSNLVRLLFMGFEIDFAGPSFLVPQMGHFGTSLTFASPFVFYALVGRFHDARAVNRVGLACILLACLAVLSHKSAMGGWQINGLRYTLDFLPMVFIFTVLGLESRRPGPWYRLGKGLIGYSIALNFVAIAVIPALNRAIGALVE